MGVKKINSRTMLYSRLLAENTEKVRRSAREQVRAARGAIHQSENILKQSQDAMERAKTTLTKSASNRKVRAAKQQAYNDSKSRR